MTSLGAVRGAGDRRLSTTRAPTSGSWSGLSGAKAALWAVGRQSTRNTGGVGRAPRRRLRLRGPRAGGCAREGRTSVLEDDMRVSEDDGRPQRVMPPSRARSCSARSSAGSRAPRLRMALGAFVSRLDRWASKVQPLVRWRRRRELTFWTLERCPAVRRRSTRLPSLRLLGEIADERDPDEDPQTSRRAGGHRSRPRA